ncbi:MAG: hypothetical protein ACNYPE_08700 [Candidatus Azotimanducaceae bacterium WSBS_2022_MAG_OTU7]
MILINSKRHVSTESIGVDISALPSIAIGRVEVLKTVPQRSMVQMRLPAL